MFSPDNYPARCTDRLLSAVRTAMRKPPLVLRGNEMHAVVDVPATAEARHRDEAEVCPLCGDPMRYVKAGVEDCDPRPSLYRSEGYRCACGHDSCEYKSTPFVGEPD